MGIVTTIKRRVIAPTLYWSRFSLLGFPRNVPGVILNYHGVIPDKSIDRINNRHVTSSQFEKDLIFYKKHFDIVPLVKFWGEPTGHSNKAKKPLLAITFDDGFVNNWRYAVPLLEKHEAPATIFVLSRSIEDPTFVNWADLLDLFIKVKSPKVIPFFDQEFVFDTNSRTFKNTNGFELSESIKNTGPERIQPLKLLQDDLMGNIKSLGKWEDFVRLMNVNELQACSRSKFVEIGSHSMWHYNLPRIPISTMVTELSESKKIIENTIHQEVGSFAYPDGDYSAETIQAAETCGYQRQCVVRFRHPIDRKDLRLRSRFSYSNSTTHESNMLRLLRDELNT